MVTVIIVEGWHASSSSFRGSVVVEIKRDNTETLNQPLLQWNLLMLLMK